MDIVAHLRHDNCLLYELRAAVYVSMYQFIRVYSYCFLSQYIYFDGYVVYNCVLVLTFSRWNLAGVGVRSDGAVGGDLGVPNLQLSSVRPNSPGNLAPCGLSVSQPLD